VDGGPPLDEQIAKVYRHAEQMIPVSTAEVNRYGYPNWRACARSFSHALSAFERMKADMAKTFGADGTYGVFVRSDTNAEDLPEFTARASTPQFQTRWIPQHHAIAQRCLGIAVRQRA
jgi:hypothetical protein